MKIKQYLCLECKAYYTEYMRCECDFSEMLKPFIVDYFKEEED